ncbi:MAG: acyl-CoA reductase [Bacteroidota bacterium]|nr:acyl-CoA reductase [Bacteroidota bacterium]
MNLVERIDVIKKLNDYIMADFGSLKAIRQKAFEKNKWFTNEFVNLSFENIFTQFLDHEKLKAWIDYYHIDNNINPKKIGIVMAGNIPLVGFHDFLCAFVTGHHQHIKFSEKDEALLTHFIEKMCEWNPKVAGLVKISSLLKDCDAYIATGSNNSARYFEYYFGKYPSIIRKNKTSVAVLSGNETTEELNLLADDVHVFFGLGCRNVTKIFVPQNYDFVPVLNAFRKYNYFSDHTKYKNNYDYNLALLIMNNKYYMTNESIILVENENIFSPVAELHYSFYESQNIVFNDLDKSENIQCIVAKDNLSFGNTQAPGLFDYADGIDTIQFLLGL